MRKISVKEFEKRYKNNIIDLVLNEGLIWTQISKTNFAMLNSKKDTVYIAQQYELKRGVN